jgi:xanthine dehydrogenase accessory factor
LPAPADPSRLPNERRPVVAAAKFINPVCGMEVDTASPKHVENYAGAAYYFCCDDCWNTFRDDPAKYASIHQNTVRSM